MPEGPIPARDPRVTADAAVLVVAVMVALVAGTIGFALILPALAFLWVALIALLVAVFVVRSPR